MSTNDVPGARPENRDTLHGGCWAEHADGTLLYVLGVEAGLVIYELFDFMDAKQPVEFRDSMKEFEFKKIFTWDPKNPKSVRWTWHDKTQFPWGRIEKSFQRGVRAVSAKKQLDDAAKVKRKIVKVRGRVKTVNLEKAFADDINDHDDIDGEELILSMARKIAIERRLKGVPISHADILHETDHELPKGGVGARIRDKIQSAIGRLRTGA